MLEPGPGRCDKPLQGRRDQPGVPPCEELQHEPLGLGPREPGEDLEPVLHYKEGISWMTQLSHAELKPGHAICDASERLSCLLAGGQEGLAVPHAGLTHEMPDQGLGVGGEIHQERAALLRVHSRDIVGKQNRTESIKLGGTLRLLTLVVPGGSGAHGWKIGKPLIGGNVRPKVIRLSVLQAKPTTAGFLP